MAKEKKKVNPLLIKPGMTIGTLSAEMDNEFLYECFVQHPAVTQSQNVSSPGMVIAARTGAGKTAIIKYIGRDARHATEIQPSDMALSYVSNSDVLRFVQAIGGDLDLLFIALWRHVLCIEFIRLRYDVANEEKSKNIFGRLWERFSRDQRKQKSLTYLKEWEGRFWITMDQNIKEITEKYEDKLQAELGAEISKFKAGGQYEKRLSTDRKMELVARAKKIIHSDQLSELAGVIDMLAEQNADDEMNKYYILIDQLDERWADDAIKYKLIRALIEALKQFRKIHNLKIVVALRSDVLERVVQETTDVGFQREKYEDYFIRLSWSKEQLRELVERRLKLTFKRQYSGATPVTFDDVFTSKVGNMAPFDYIVERTLMRPRDMIAFVNECMKLGVGRQEIGANMIKHAEREYSRVRRQSLENEWHSAFPSLPRALDYIASFQKVSITFPELCGKEEVLDLALRIAETKLDLDPIHGIASQAFEEEINLHIFVREILSLLYRVGAIGVKPSPAERFYYSHLDQPLMAMGALNAESRVRIHPMLHSCMGLAPG